jgi:DNA-binding NarL/FixJ family response regulator
MRILVVENHPIFREIFSKACASVLEANNVTSVGCGAEALRQLATGTVSLLVLDLYLPDIDGLEIAEAARKLSPGIRTIIVTSHCDEFTVFCVERIRAEGFIDNRSLTPDNLMDALARVAGNGTYFSPSFLALKRKRTENSASFDKILSDREMKILQLVGVPYNDSEIGERLGISRATVEKHRFNILRKLELTTTTALIRFARSRGFAPRIQA